MRTTVPRVVPMPAWLRGLSTTGKPISAADASASATSTGVAVGGVGNPTCSMATANRSLNRHVRSASGSGWPASRASPPSFSMASAAQKLT